MAKETITEAWIFAGKTYLPGEHDFPDDAHKALKARGAFGQQERQAEGKAAADQPAEATAAPAKKAKE